jgi:hypothetical protein
MSATYGLRSSTSSASAALAASLASRLPALLDSRGSTMFALTWKAQATPQRRLICRLVASAHRTGDSGSTGWPTTTVQDASSSARHGYMLTGNQDTTLLDAMRQQLKLSDLIVANFSPDLLPELISWQASAALEVPLGPEFSVPMSKMYYAPVLQTNFVKPSDVFMFIDPAGGGTDEIGIGVGTSLGPYIHVLDVVGLKGGLTPENEKELCQICRAGFFKIQERNLLLRPSDFRQCRYNDRHERVC